MAERLILIRHSSALRAVTDQEVLATLSADDLRLAREIVSVDTTPFAEDAAVGDWDRSTAYLRERAAAILQFANADPRAVELRYFGLAEIPDVIALGAFLGDERYVRVIDYDRHGEEWAWPATDQTLDLATTPLPMERLTQPGIAVLRVSVSASITDVDVEAAVGRESLADVTIQPADGVPNVGLVRSFADVEHVRTTVRSAMSAIIAARLGVEAIHLFVAAPVSACFVIGQELHLRSTVPVQTYRFRKADGDTAYVEAIRLTARASAASESPLSDADLAHAAHVREIWKKALASVQAYAAARKKEPLKSERLV